MPGRNRSHPRSEAAATQHALALALVACTGDRPGHQPLALHGMLEARGLIPLPAIAAAELVEVNALVEVEALD